MLSESAAIKLVARKYRHKRLGYGIAINGRTKKLRGPNYSCDSSHLGWAVINLMTDGMNRWGLGCRASQLRKRANKKRAQPFRRKMRGRLKRKAAGKNNVRPRRR